MFGTCSEQHRKTHWNHLVCIHCCGAKGEIIQRRRRRGENPPTHTFCWTLCSFSHDCPIALPYRRGGGKNARLCTVIFMMTQFSLFAEETEGQQPPAELWFWFIFLAQLFSAMASPPSIMGCSLICTGTMKRSWGLGSREAFDGL